MSTAALVSTHREYGRLFSIYVPIGLGILVFIAVGMPVVALIFRRRPPERAARWHDAHLIEGTYAVVLAAVVAFLLYKTFGVEHQIDTVANHEKGGVTIKVVGSRWEWSFYYQRYHITLHSGETGDSDFVVPVNEPIHFYLTSVDVIHSFWIPALNYKHDAFPGNTQEVTLTFTSPGTFTGQCAEFCGYGHSEMVFTARAVSRARFGVWASSGGKTL